MPYYNKESSSFSVQNTALVVLGFLAAASQVPSQASAMPAIDCLGSEVCSSRDNLNATGQVFANATAIALWTIDLAAACQPSNSSIPAVLDQIGTPAGLRPIVEQQIRSQLPSEEACYAVNQAIISFEEANPDSTPPSSPPASQEDDKKSHNTAMIAGAASALVVAGCVAALACRKYSKRSAASEASARQNAEGEKGVPSKILDVGSVMVVTSGKDLNSPGSVASH